jgi:hypothetical protein
VPSSICARVCTSPISYAMYKPWSEIVKPAARKLNPAAGHCCTTGEAAAAIRADTH